METEANGHVDRRDRRQQAGRHIGWVVSCTGSSAIISCPIDGRNHPVSTPSIGNLVTIATDVSRVIGFVRSVATQSQCWQNDGMNDLVATIDLVGEIVDRPEGPLFQRGIQTYPQLGAETHRIRHEDLQSIYRISGGVGIEIGRLSQDNSIAATIDMRTMLKRHFSIVGTTGVGKSTALSVLVRKAVEAQSALRVVILDPHNEFAAAFPGEARVLDTKNFEIPYWLLRFEEFTELVFRGRDVAEGEIDFLREAVETAKAAFAPDSKGGLQAGSILKRSFRDQTETASADQPTPFRLTDIYAQIDEEMGRLESRYQRYDLKSLRYRLKEVAEDPNFSFLFGKASVDNNTADVLGKLYNLPDGGRRISILQMAGIPAEAVNVVVSVIARIGFDMAMLSAGRVETLLVCEEAHRYIPNDIRLGFAPTRRAIARIAKEGRKYGAYLGIVTQRPGELDPTILSQCSTIFAMRLSNDTDQEIIRSAIADSSAGILAFLSAMGGREAIAFGEAIATPMRMKFVEVDSAHQPAPAWLDNSAGPKEVDLRDIAIRMRGEATTANQALPHEAQTAAARHQAGTPAMAAQRMPNSSEPWPAFSGGFRLR